MIFAGLALIFGLLTRQPRRYWAFAVVAVVIHVSAGLVLVGWETSRPKGLHALGSAMLVWGVPILVALRGHARRNVDVAIWTLRSRVARTLLGAHVTALVARTENGRLAVDPEDYTVGWQLRKRGKYGLAELERVQQYIDANGRVLVVGAHIGSLAVPLSRMCREVVAIEADPATYELLATNLLLNDVANCRALNVAASDRAGTIEFLVQKRYSSGNKRAPIAREDRYRFHGARKITVQAVALDAYLDDPRFDVVLMDIEGSEYFALQGMQRILEHASALVVEFLPDHLRDVSGVTVEQFLSAIPPRFRTLRIPSKGLTVEAGAFLATLSRMFERGEKDYGLIFAAAGVNDLPAERSPAAPARA